MKNNLLIKALSLMLVCSVANTFTMNDENVIVCQRPDKEEKKINSELIATPQNERDTQKAIILLAAAGGIGAVAHFFGDRPEFQTAGNFFNLGRGELQAACALSSTCAGFAIFADKEWRPMFRSWAWRFPLMAIIGGALSHPKANKILEFTPLFGSWFKEHSPFGKPGITAIYNIGAWYGLKPSLDRVENAVSSIFVSKNKRK